MMIVVAVGKSSPRGGRTDNLASCTVWYVVDEKWLSVRRVSLTGEKLQDVLEDIKRLIARFSPTNEVTEIVPRNDGNIFPIYGVPVTLVSDNAHVLLYDIALTGPRSGNDFQVVEVFK